MEPYFQMIDFYEFGKKKQWSDYQQSLLMI